MMTPDNLSCRAFRIFARGSRKPCSVVLEGNNSRTVVNGEFESMDSDTFSKDDFPLYADDFPLYAIADKSVLNKHGLSNAIIGEQSVQAGKFITIFSKEELATKYRSATLGGRSKSRVIVSIKRISAFRTVLSDLQRNGLNHVGINVVEYSSGPKGRFIAPQVLIERCDRQTPESDEIPDGPPDEKPDC